MKTKKKTPSKTTRKETIIITGFILPGQRLPRMMTTLAASRPLTKAEKELGSVVLTD